MSQAFTRRPSVLATVLLSGTVALIAAAAGFVEGHKMGIATRECPAFQGNRPLIAYNLTTGRCHYSPVPRPALDLSPTELRRMAKARERMERTR